MRSNRSFAHGGEIPIIMSRAFSQNTKAAEIFSSLSSQHRQALIDGAFSPSAFANMQSYIDSFDGSSNNMSYPDNMIFY